jgi:hypothetical protein
VADQGNNLIRKITPNGVVTTLAGSGAQAGIDGQGTAASFAGPIHLALDSAGNIYVSDASSYTIRKITPSGWVSTIVGQGGNQNFQAGPLPGVISQPTAVVTSKQALYISMLHAIAKVS